MPSSNLVPFTRSSNPHSGKQAQDGSNGAMASLPAGAGSTCRSAVLGWVPMGTAIAPAAVFIDAEWFLHKLLDHNSKARASAQC